MYTCINKFSQHHSLNNFLRLHRRQSSVRVLQTIFIDVSQFVKSKSDEGGIRPYSTTTLMRAILLTLKKKWFIAVNSREFLLLTSMTICLSGIISLLSWIETLIEEATRKLFHFTVTQDHVEFQSNSATNLCSSAAQLPNEYCHRFQDDDYFKVHPIEKTLSGKKHNSLTMRPNGSLGSL